MGKNDQFEVDIYDGLIDESCIKTMKGEIYGLIFFLITSTGLGHAVLNSERGIYYFDGIQISLYYLFPFFLGILCIMIIFSNILKEYWKVVFEVDENNRGTLIRILGGQDIYLKSFEIILDENKLGFKNKGHLEYFKRVYYHYIGVKVGKRVYLIPYADGKKEDVINILLEKGGILS
ncbi:hypothetical protein RFH42_09215 [Acinetobacter rudis]|uniref:hypothetical protein n=1 Tax=Acinetobacter rudis TaxID=632955 RepID=UPI00280D4CA2|nr:hypothetical protein [Acinetobacter rudis]MDQ8953138.1 hypothetical protein [Acinetobacter rudis]